MSLVPIVSILLFGQAQFAPSDVPKDHWAYPAVNKLFGEGLLKGYPDSTSQLLKLDIGAKQDIDWLTTYFKNLYKRKYVQPFSPPLNPAPRPPSIYEIAVYIHAIAVNAIDKSNHPSENQAFLVEIRKELPNLAKAISQTRFELGKLGVDPADLIAKLNSVQSPTGFHGG